MKKRTAFILSIIMIISVFGNIIVNAEDAPLVSMGVVEFYDFEDKDTQEFTQTGKYLDDKVWIPMLMSGDSLSVVEESGGNKALKVTRKLENATASESRFVFVFDKAYKGKVDVSFDYKIENNNGSCASFMSLGSSTSSGYSTPLNSFIAGTYWYTPLRATDGYNNWGNTGQLGTDWVPMSLSIDIANGKFSGNTYRFYGKSNQSFQKKEWNFSNTDVADIQYLCIAAITNNSGDLLSSRTADAVYYIDNIKVVHYDYPKMEAESSFDGKTIAVDENVEVVFNEAVAAESLTKDMFILTSDEKTVDDYIVSADASGKIVSIIPENGWDYGKSYNLTVKEDISALRGKVYNMEEDYSFDFVTEDIIGDINIEEGGRYNAQITPSHNGVNGVDYSFFIKTSDGEYADYDMSSIDVEDNYVIKITAQKNGKTQTKEIPFSVIGEVAPVAKNVGISGEMVLGGILSGEYTFLDENGDEEGESEYRWLLSDTKNGKYSEIAGASYKTVEINESFVDKYVKFKVTPVSQREPYKGEAVTSEGIVGLFRPTAENAIVTKEENKLSFTYDYHDENSDAEGESEIKWYYQTEKNGKYTLIEGAVSKEYTLSDNDDNKYISAAVVPKSVNYPYIGNEVKSNAVTSNFNPTATELNIIGTAKEGQTIGAEYTYYDADGDEEGKSIIKWYVNGKEVGEGGSLYLQKSYTGYKVYFTVTPVSLKDGKNGDAVKSVEKKIESGGKTATSSSGGGGGGTSVKPSPSVTTPPDSTKDTENDGTVFKDIKEHWAKEYIEELYKKNIITGISANEYGPEKTLTRAQTAVILKRALNLKAGEAAFDDVEKSDWYYEGIAACAGEELIKGSGGLFRPNDEITREELCVIIARIVGGREEYKREDIEFSDKDEISDWAVNSVALVSKLGIVTGMENGGFYPKNNTTRAQAAVVISRVLNIIGGGNDE